MKTHIVAAVLAFIANAAIAQNGENSNLDRLTRSYEQAGWEAVGRVDIRGGGFCTGALIAPDLVLTAAHCLVDTRSGTPYDPSRLLFRAGYADGNEVAFRRGAQSVVHPEYLDRTSSRSDTSNTDIGLIKLDSPIPTTIASPFAIGEQSIGSQVSVVSYARGRSEALSWQRSCAVVGKYRSQGVAAFTCDVTFGSSGAPVFDTSRNRPMIVSLISRGRNTAEGTIAFGPMIKEPIQELKEALRTSHGVNLAGGGLASRIQVTKGAKFVTAGQGSRFVKP